MKTKFQTESRGTSAGWDELARKVEEAAKRATGLALHQMERDAKLVARARFKSDHPGAGYLANSIEVHGPTGGSGRYTGQVGPTAIYGRIQELGGDIFSHGNYPLRNKDTGQVFGRHVRIRSDHPYLKPGVEMTKPMIGDIVRAEIAKATES